MVPKLILITVYDLLSVKSPLKGPVCESLQHLVAKKHIAKNGNVITLFQFAVASE